MKKIIIFILLIFILETNFYALETTSNLELDIIDTKELLDALPNSSQRFLEDMTIGIEENLDFGSTIMNIVNEVLSSPERLIRQSIEPILKILVIVMICSVALGFSDKNNFTEKIINISGSLSVSAIMLTGMDSVFSMCIDAIKELDVFSKALLPVSSGVFTMMGMPLTGVTTYTATIFAFNLLVGFISGVLSPMVYIYIAMATINASLSNDMLKKICELIKWGVTTLLKFFLTVFVSYITVSSVITSNFGSITIKTAKFAVSGAIPIVGGIISDATETFLSSAVVLKNSVGIFGLIGIISICFLPLLKVGLNYLLFKVCAVLISPIATKSLSGLIENLSGSFGLLLGMLSTCSAILFAEIVITIVFVRPI